MVSLAALAVVEVEPFIAGVADRDRSVDLSAAGDPGSTEVGERRSPLDAAGYADREPHGDRLHDRGPAGPGDRGALDGEGGDVIARLGIPRHAHPELDGLGPRRGPGEGGRDREEPGRRREARPPCRPEGEPPVQVLSDRLRFNREAPSLTTEAHLEHAA